MIGEIRGLRLIETVVYGQSLILITGILPYRLKEALSSPKIESRCGNWRRGNQSFWDRMFIEHNN